ncbi:MAG: HD domain-containing protein [Flavobacteriaceae bacterium]|nr:HD domain-containing protein [Flavobacteriaceae bacterium]
MKKSKSNKLKIFNDPVYGFISIPDAFIFDLIEHKNFQRLRRISQTGLTHYVYPGSTHSRFLHALGCLHLMQKAVDTLRQKNVKISEEEERAVYIAILLHDIGHGPFSHALESTIVEGVNHEDISLKIMKQLNQEFDGALDLTIEIFTQKYSRKFLSQLIASQLDIDRLDYLKRDSFFTGVTEGNIGSDRIISMMNVFDNQLVIDAKGIYSVEKYLISRMFMYWQVYLHKTAFGAEIYLIQALKRAKELYRNGQSLETTQALGHFLKRDFTEQFSEKDLEVFTRLDDNDVLFSLKQWQWHSDSVLSTLAKSVIQRKLPRVEIRNNRIPEDEIENKKDFIEEVLGKGTSPYFVHESFLKIVPYERNLHPVMLLEKGNRCIDIAESEKQILTQPLFETTTKYHFCYWDKEKFERLM